MPFTLAHPVAALAIRHLSGDRLRLAPLVVGSLAPDFEYFLRMYPGSGSGHTPLGLLMITLPLAWIALILFDHFGLEGMKARLPPGWAIECAPPQSMVATIASLALGAASHVTWDAFTHAAGFGVQLLPALASPMIGSIAGYRVLQHASSIVGLALLAVPVVRWARLQPRVPVASWLRPLVLASALLAFAGLANAMRFAPEGMHAFVVGGGVAVAFLATTGPIVLGLRDRFLGT
jgi:hypothetical protein